MHPLEVDPFRALMRKSVSLEYRLLDIVKRVIR
jgi:hypothetical protein